MDFGKVLTELRKSKNLSRQNLADNLEISVHTYIKYENESVKPPYETLIKLADFYGVTADHLLGREPLPNPFADYNITEEDEREVIEKYMSLPPEVRACMLDALRKMGSAIKNPENPDPAEEPPAAPPDNIASDIAETISKGELLFSQNNIRKN